MNYQLATILFLFSFLILLEWSTTSAVAIKEQNKVGHFLLWDWLPFTWRLHFGFKIFDDDLNMRQTCTRKQKSKEMFSFVVQFFVLLSFSYLHHGVCMRSNSCSIVCWNNSIDLSICRWSIFRPIDLLLFSFNISGSFDICEILIQKKCSIKRPMEKRENKNRKKIHGQ